jgi:hypothetical protein
MLFGLNHGPITAAAINSTMTLKANATPVFDRKR